MPGLGVDLDDGDVGAEGVGRAVGLEVGLGLEAALARGRGHLGPRPGHRRGALHVERAVGPVEHDVGGVGLEQVGGELAGLVEHLARRL